MLSRKRHSDAAGAALPGWGGAAPAVRTRGRRAGGLWGGIGRRRVGRCFSGCRFSGGGRRFVGLRCGGGVGLPGSCCLFAGGAVGQLPGVVGDGGQGAVEFGDEAARDDNQEADDGVDEYHGEAGLHGQETELVQAEGFAGGKEDEEQ